MSPAHTARTDRSAAQRGMILSWGERHPPTGPDIVSLRPRIPGREDGGPGAHRHASRDDYARPIIL